MKIRELLDKLDKLDPDMDLNDLRACATTNADDVESLRHLLDERADSWDEYGARLVSRVVVPLLLEQRDLLLMPASEKGWVKPAEMAKKVSEQVDIVKAACTKHVQDIESTCAERVQTIEADCAERVLAAVADRVQKVAEAQAGFDAKLSILADEHMARATRLEDTHRDEMNEATGLHRAELGTLHTKLRYADEQRHAELNLAATRRQEDAERAEIVAKEQTRVFHEMAESVPGKQANAVADALTQAADKSEALARMRLVRMSKRKGIFRNRDLDDAMLRVEADGLKLAAVKLRTMSEEARESQWPVEFASGEEADAPDVVVESDIVDLDDEAEDVRVAEEA